MYGGKAPFKFDFQDSKLTFKITRAIIEGTNGTRINYY